MIKRFNKNETGRDFAVGDIHGHFSRLQASLDAIGFDPACDRLFSVGDLVDRGPECRDCLEWIDRPWFHPVRGNHDDYVCRFDTCDVDNWVYNGGSWFAGLNFDEQREFSAQFNELPFAIEVETDGGLIGIVHADVPGTSWGDLNDYMRNRNGRNYLLWSRNRFENEDASGVKGVRAVICGHTPLRSPVVLGNVYHVDTGGWFPDDSGHFTFINLSTLECIPAIPSRLLWS
jgi:serine/threonine protein phosphatase 1